MLRHVPLALLGCLGLLCLQPMPGCTQPVPSGESQGEITEGDAGGVDKSGVDSEASEQSKEPVQDTQSVDQGPAKEAPAEPRLEPAAEPKAEATPEPQREEPPRDAAVAEAPIVEEPVVTDAPTTLEQVPELRVDNTPKDKTPPKPCASDADCGKRTCTQVGLICKRTTPICRSGSCVDLKVDIADTTCDTSTGVCRAPKPKCKETCDCPQGLMCIKDANNEGTCIAGFVPTYCCVNGGCPAGKACVERGGGSGVCP